MSQSRRKQSSSPTNRNYTEAEKRAILTWAGRQAKPGAIDELENGPFTVRLIGRVEGGKTGEITIPTDKETVLKLLELAAHVPDDALQTIVEVSTPFAECPIVMISSNKPPARETSA